MGGQDGSDMAIMLHRYHFSGLAKYVGAGVYLGGIGPARAMVETFQASPKDFKFIFNTVEWGPGVLLKELEMGRWDVCEIPVDMVLSQDSRVFTNMWSSIRASLSSSSSSAALVTEGGESNA